MPPNKTGAYYSAQRPDLPPWPFNPFPELPVSEFVEGRFIFDDWRVDYEQLRVVAAERAFLLQSQEAGASVAEQPASYACALWLTIRTSNELALLTVHNTLPGTNYQIWSKQNVASNAWTWETNFVGASGQDWTDMAIPTNGRPLLFIQVTEDLGEDGPGSYSVARSFEGLSYWTLETVWNPPDTMGAVGLDHFVELINGWVAVFDKCTGERLELERTTNFFTAQVDGTNYPAGTAVLDPRIVYDHRAHRWIGCAGDFLGSDQVLLAISHDSSPTGLSSNWTKYLVPVARSGSGSSPDFPTLGLDQNGIYVTVLQRHSESGRVINDGHTVVAIKKPEIYQGTNLQTRLELTNTALSVELDAWTIQPAVNLDPLPANGAAWFVAKGSPDTNCQGGPIYYRRLHWSGTNADWADTNWWSAVDADPPQTYCDYYDLDCGGVTAPQRGGSNRIDLQFDGASRLMMAVIRSNWLWTCHHIGLGGTNGVWPDPQAGTNVDRSAIQWLKLHITSNDPVLSYGAHGRIHDTAAEDPFYYFMPSLMVNSVGDMVMGFSGSSATNYIGAYWSWRLASGSTSGGPLLLQAGKDHYGGSGIEKWGDYSCTSLDPIDGLTLWTIQEYADIGGGTPVWATWVAGLKPGP